MKTYCVTVVKNVFFTRDFYVSAKDEQEANFIALTRAREMPYESFDYSDGEHDAEAEQLSFPGDFYGDMSN